MGDLISRQDAKDVVDMELDAIDHVPEWVYDRLLTALDKVPSTQPELAQNMHTTCTDTISRQAAIDEISKQQTYKMFEGEDTVYFDANDVGSVLVSLPSAQPDIIRCKDCKHYYYADNRIPQEQRYSCALDGDRWKPEDFCSYAERKTE